MGKNFNSGLSMTSALGWTPTRLSSEFGNGAEVSEGKARTISSTRGHEGQRLPASSKSQGVLLIGQKAPGPRATIPVWEQSKQHNRKIEGV
jgi:hypothetical protein